MRKILALVALLLSALPAAAQFNGGGGGGASYTFGAGLTNTANTITLGDSGLGYASGVMDLSTSLGLGSATSPIAVLSAPGAGKFELSVGGTDVLDYGVSNSAQWTMGSALYVNVGDGSLIQNSTGSIYTNNFSAVDGSSRMQVDFVSWISAPKGIAFGGDSSGYSTTSAISTPSSGLLSVDTTTPGNAAGKVQLALINLNTYYSAAGTALPTCNTAAKGSHATVSDATVPTYLGTYTSGGAVIAPVFCNGTNWLTD